MAGWIINTVRIGIEQRRISQKIKDLKKNCLKRQTVDWAAGQMKEPCQGIYMWRGRALLWWNGRLLTFYWLHLQR